MSFYSITIKLIKKLMIKLFINNITYIYVKKQYIKYNYNAYKIKS